ncbi:amino acid/polyamine/organocation transporter, APC superfamily [Flavobacteriaceae bacterium MAR_2010_188]|nr:amino acid/polyamine/organocation transporter, APC superfamily [Flavobacteriaceae bacterium MAR_2010_188]
MAKNQKIGLITSTSLVIGNMIGVGIFVLPAALASYGSISLLGWIFTAAGALVLAKIFGNCSKIIVNQSGGPYTYARAGFGDFIGFLVAWGYWLSIWISNSAIAIAIVGALTFFFPDLETNNVLRLLLGLGFIWLFAFINSRGIKSSGRIQVITTVLKILPLIFVIIVGLFFFKFENFPAFNITGETDLTALATVATLTLYAFMGIESATVPAENVDNPEITVSQATMLGSIITTIIYILGTVVLFGILPVDLLQNSAAPFAEAAKMIGGEYSGYFVAVGVIISGLGVLNGWTLIMGQIPLATAKDGLFPKIFKRENKQGAPIFGIIIGSVLTSLLLIMNFTDGLVDQFKFIVEIAVFVVLVPYLIVAAAYVMILIDRNLHFNNRIKTFLLGGIGMAFSIWAIYGSGRDTVFYGFLMLILGIPCYLIIKWNSRNTQK